MPTPSAPSRRSPKGPFWRFARELFRSPRHAIAAFTAAGVSALGLGAGLTALMPVVKQLLEENAPSLRDLATDGRAKLPGWAASWVS
ncbi:MAG: hypothetical protein ACTS27_12495, partial [Phycisphaerales bacterium]